MTTPRITHAEIADYIIDSLRAAGYSPAALLHLKHLYVRPLRITVEQFATERRIDRKVLYYLFTKSGLPTFSRFIHLRRELYAVALLQEGLSSCAAADLAAFDSAFTLSNALNKHYGMRLAAARDDLRSWHDLYSLWAKLHNVRLPQSPEKEAIQ